AGAGVFVLSNHYKPGMDPAAPVAPASIVSHDLDGDGKLDLIVANELENQLSVLLGDGTGTFASEARPLANGQPISLVVGDFNGDNKPDLAAAAWDGDAVQVLLNTRPRRCDEGFDTASNAELGPAPQAIAGGDFNGDGKPDLAVIDSSEISFRVLLGTGNGSYRPSTPIPIPAGGGDHFVAADFNTDGKLDIATPNVEGATLFTGSGTGTFGAPAPAIGGFYPSSLAAGDFNGDDKLDLVTTVEGGTISIFLFSGSAFGAPSHTYVGNNPVSVAVADFNRDGRRDIVFVDLVNVRVMFGDGTGAFEAPIDLPHSGSEPRYVMTTDFNGDGFADLAVANRDSADVTLFFGKGDRTFEPAVSYPVGPEPRWLAADDLTGDGKLDLLVGFSSGRFAKLLPGNGALKSFGAPSAWDFAATPVAVTAADFDGDGDKDLAAVVASAAPRLTTLPGNGDGTFPVLTTYPTGEMPHQVCAADFDRDGALDLAASLLVEGEVSVLPGVGDGTLAATAVSTAVTSPGAAVHADLDADGVLDLAVASGATGKLLVMLGTSTGGFALPVSYTFPGTNPAPSAVKAADFNRDGALDLVVANGGANNVCFFYGNGLGAFAVPPIGE
ncbi:MAG TPA: hypothetical protein DFS52_24800, partial [Myxococcales bacterium]|nr:hypothetical protein [Myxococcales bacterium]